jgi:mono/diheme cytochrome c family protein
MRSLLISAAAAVFAAQPAVAVEVGDKLAGLAYAEKNCAECHEVEPVDSFSPNPDAPTFKEVANTPGMSARALNVWFRTSHPTMPDFIIAEGDADNLVAYILSLRDTK